MGQYTTHFICTFNMEYYPFDIQKCNMTFMLAVQNRIFLLLETPSHAKQLFQISDQRYSKPLPGSLVFEGSKSLVQYVVIDYTIKGYTGVNSDTELVEVGIIC